MVKMCIVGKRSLFSCRQSLRKISGGQHNRQKTTPFSLLAASSAGPDPTHLRKRFSPRYRTAWSRRTPALVVELRTLQLILLAISLVGKNQLLCVSTIQFIANSLSRFPDPHGTLFAVRAGFRATLSFVQK